MCIQLLSTIMGCYPIMVKYKKAKDHHQKCKVAHRPLQHNFPDIFAAMLWHFTVIFKSLKYPKMGASGRVGFWDKEFYWLFH